MRIDRTVKAAVLIVAAVILILFASILLLAAESFGFAAGEFMIDPQTGGEYKAKMERAAYFAFSLFLAVEAVLAGLVVMSGLMRDRLHWAARACGALLVGVILSYQLVLLTLSRGELIRFLAELERTIAGWIRTLV